MSQKDRNRWKALQEAERGHRVSGCGNSGYDQCRRRFQRQMGCKSGMSMPPLALRWEVQALERTMDVRTLWEEPYLQSARQSKPPVTG
jgi:hypothetical protein